MDKFMEELAFRLTELEEWQGMLLNFGTFVAGFLVALMARRGATLSLRRVPHLQLLSLHALALALAGFLGLLVPSAVEAGRMWMVMATQFAVMAVGGYILGVLSHARSVNAYGDGRHAWMGIIPIANLILMTKRPLDWQPDTWRTGFLNALGVLGAVIMMVISAMFGRLAEIQVARSAGPPVDVELVRDAMANSDTLEASLMAIASQVRPQPVTEDMALERIESDGDTLRHVYEVTADIDSLPGGHTMAMAETTCSDQALRPLLEAGATIQYLYLNPDGWEIGTVFVVPAMCGIDLLNLSP
jgi:hypothetical protein